MTKTPVRLALERHLPRPLTDSQWDLLVSRGEEEAMLRGRKTPKQVAVELEEWCQLMGQGPAGSEPLPSGTVSRTSAAESDRERRQEAVSLALARMAENSEDVDSFRRTHLPDYPHLLAWEDVEAWIRARAAEEGPPTEYVEIPLPPGTVLRRDSGAAASVFYPRLQIREIPAHVPVHPLPKDLIYGTREGLKVKRQPIAAGATLDRLRELSERLTKRYGWSPEQATVFVLTGEVPRHALLRTTRALRTSLPVLSRIELSIDPAVTPEELAEYYRKARRRMMPKDRRLRAQDRKALELAVFASGRDEGEDWKDTLVAWNKACGEEHEGWKYEGGKERNFSRDLRQALSRLLYPPYVDPSAMAGDGDGLRAGTTDVSVTVRGEDDV